MTLFLGCMLNPNQKLVLQELAKTITLGIYKNVHLVPLTWDDEVMILKRELARAWSSLKLEEHRNRNLPELVDVDSPEAYDKMADASAKSLINFLDQQDIVTVKTVL